MPAGTPGHIPGRRTSYASVLSGTSGNHGQQGAMASGAFSHLLNQPNIHGNESQYGNSWRDGRVQSDRNGQYDSREENGQLPSHSSAYHIIAGLDGYGSSPDGFFIPSYLKDSTYIRRLEESHNAKPPASPETSRPGSLSASTSTANLTAKVAQSHRGMTYDLIEKAPPLNDESLSPLPSKWNTNDKYSGLEVMSDGREVKYTGSRASERDHEAYSIRSDHPMPPQCGIYYFEVTILSRKREESSVGIGFSSKEVPLSRPPGWEPDSWAYHGDDGHSFCGQSSGKQYGPPFTTGDTVGCGVNFRTGCAFFTKNGDDLGTAFREVKGKLFPSVGVRRSGEHVRVNFGQSPFIFDIDYVMKAERRAAREKITNTSTAKLSPPLDETSLIQTLVLQYLSHDGYVETARAFSSEVQQERDALRVDPSSTISLNNFSNVKEDEDAINRQRIRAAILDGDVDKALKHTNAYYPNVLKDNELIYFSLRSRKFIEMMRQAAELREPIKSTSSSLKPSKNGNNTSTFDGLYDEIVNNMDLDNPVAQVGFDRMDTTDTHDMPANQVSYDQLLQDAIEYGQGLQAEFQHDPRIEVKRALTDCFSLLAYEDPITNKQVSHLLRREGRAVVAEELNGAILVSLGKSSSAALERLIQQSTVLIDELREGQTRDGAFVNIEHYMRPRDDVPTGYI